MLFQEKLHLKNIWILIHKQNKYREFRRCKGPEPRNGSIKVNLSKPQNAAGQGGDEFEEVSWGHTGRALTSMGDMILIGTYLIKFVLNGDESGDS